MIATAQRILATRLFSRAAELRTIPQIVWWWEMRRVPYNLIVGLTGILTCFLVVAISGLIPRGESSLAGGGSPIFEIASIILYGIVANACYSGGWISEILAKAIWKERAGAIGEISFAFGLVFSVVVTLLPAIVIFCFALSSMVLHPH